MTVPRELPIFLQLRLVSRVPFQDVPECATREPSRDEPVPDAHRNPVFAVRCVEMRWFVVTVENRDHDTEETTDFRHGPTLATNRRVHHLRITPASAAAPSNARCRPLQAEVRVGVAIPLAHFSTTRSARASTDCGIVRPRALAVFSRVEDWRKTPWAPLGCVRRFQLRARVGSP